MVLRGREVGKGGRKGGKRDWRERATLTAVCDMIR